jgi:hypothetical protein
MTLWLVKLPHLSQVPQQEQFSQDNRLAGFSCGN